MIPNVQLMKDDVYPFDDLKRYRRLVGKLNYLVVNRLDIAFLVSVVIQFMSSPRVKHCNDDYDGSNIDRRSTTGCCKYLCWREPSFMEE